MVDTAPPLQPLTLDLFPNSGIPTPGAVAIDVAGIAPASSVFVAINCPALGAGGAPLRTPTASPGHCELFIDLADPCFPLSGTVIAPNPVAITEGPDYGSCVLQIPVALPPTVAVLQAVDLLTLAVSPPNLVQF